MPAQDQPGGAVETVETVRNRYNGLMSSHQRALAENAALKAQLAGAGSSEAVAQSPEGTPQQADDDQPEPFEFEEGVSYLIVNGQPVAQEPPTPGQHSEIARTLAGFAKREPTMAELQAKSDQEVGKPSRGSDPWADITSR